MRVLIFNRFYLYSTLTDSTCLVEFSNRPRGNLQLGREFMIFPFDYLFSPSRLPFIIEIRYDYFSLLYNIKKKFSSKYLINDIWLYVWRMDQQFSYINNSNYENNRDDLLETTLQLPCGSRHTYEYLGSRALQSVHTFQLFFVSFIFLFFFFNFFCWREKKKIYYFCQLKSGKRNKKK